jgi:hypothetical protein
MLVTVEHLTPRSTSTIPNVNDTSRAHSFRPVCIRTTSPHGNSTNTVVLETGSLSAAVQTVEQRRGHKYSPQPFAINNPLVYNFRYVLLELRHGRGQHVRHELLSLGYWVASIFLPWAYGDVCEFASAAYRVSILH